MLGSLLNIYVLSGCQVLMLVFFRCSPSFSQKGPPEPDISTNERGGRTDRLSFSVQPGLSLAAHFAQPGLVAGLWGKVFAGSIVRGKAALQNLLLALCSGKITIMPVKCGLRGTLCGWSCFYCFCPPSSPFLLTYAEVCNLFNFSFSNNPR